MKRTTSGFTIVELLIVIVVIGILAAITIVAYSGFQQRGRDAVRLSAVSSVKKSLELYLVDNGTYPIYGAVDTGYDLSVLSTYLVPKYIAAIPVDPKQGGLNYQYVHRNTGAAYGIYTSYEAKTPCKTGVGHEGVGWWNGVNC